jgi:hypothetical protein
MSTSMHTSKGKLIFNFSNYDKQWEVGTYPALTIHCEEGNNRDSLTMFPSYEQVKQLHAELGKFIQTFEPTEESSKNEENHSTTV